jgi:hypothetical protein
MIKHSSQKLSLLAVGMLLLVVVLASGALTPLMVTATMPDFVPLSPNLPVIGGVSDMAGLLNGLMGISVAVASLLAVIMLTIGGFKYMTTDSSFQMGSAKEQIANAIIGLLIVLAAILLLETINPEIVSMNLFKPI